MRSWWTGGSSPSTPGTMAAANRQRGRSSVTPVAPTGVISVIRMLKDADVTLGGPVGVEVSAKAPASALLLAVGRFIVSLIPMVVIIGGVFWYYRQGFNFGGKSLVKPSQLPRVTFDNVAGAEEAKFEMQEVVEFLKSPAKFTAMGAGVPKGVLLTGEPGTGKTLLARAVAGEAGVPFFYISGSGFVELFVGLAANRMRGLFKEAKKKAPCIVFIDEIDAIGGTRGSGAGMGEQEQALNQMLTEMDGFVKNPKAVVVVAATNRPQVLDVALLRPGRFDRKIPMDLPSVQERREILEVHAIGKPVAPGVVFDTIAASTPGFSGADLANLMNEAAILAVRHNLDAISMLELEEASERVTMGPERKSLFLSPQEQEVVAYHEAGHALVGWMLPKVGKVRRVSVVPRGRSGGHTSFLPADDQHLQSKSQLEDTLAVHLAGRAAEEAAFGDLTSGACEDIRRAWELAMRMVDDFGMVGMNNTTGQEATSSNSSTGTSADNENNPSGDPLALAERPDLVLAVGGQIEIEASYLITLAHDRAKVIITDNTRKLEWLAEYLLEHKSASGDDLDRLLGERPQPQL